MPKFIYTGVSRHDPNKTDGNRNNYVYAYDVFFPKGTPVEVTKDFLIKKCERNEFFIRAPDESTPAAVGLPIEAPEIGAALTDVETEAPPTPKRRGRPKKETT